MRVWVLYSFFIGNVDMQVTLLGCLFSELRADNIICENLKGFLFLNPFVRDF